MSNAADLTQSTDEDLAQSARDGDGRAFELLATRFERRVFGLCRVVLRDPHEAADATQEAFLRAYKHLERFDPSRRFAPWILTIASRVARDMAEKKKPVPQSEFAEESRAAEDDPSMVLSDREDLGRLRAAIDQLPERERLAIYLRFVQGVDPPEVAEAIGVTANNLRVVLCRAKAHLRAILDATRAARED